MSNGNKPVKWLRADGRTFQGPHGSKKLCQYSIERLKLRRHRCCRYQSVRQGTSRVQRIGFVTFVQWTRFVCSLNLLLNSLTTATWTALRRPYGLLLNMRIWEAVIHTGFMEHSNNLYELHHNLYSPLTKRGKKNQCLYIFSVMYYSFG